MAARMREVALLDLLSEGRSSRPGSSSFTSAEFWNATLTDLCRHVGLADPVVEVKVACVDSKRQWARWRSVWYNAAVRSLDQSVTGPRR